MNRSNQVQQHYAILGWLLIVEHAILLIVAAFVFVLLMGIGAISGDREAMAVLSIVATSVAALLVLLSVPGIVAGVGVLKNQPWGRVLAMAVGILGLVNVPVGTLVGVYALGVLLVDWLSDSNRSSLVAQSA